MGKQISVADAVGRTIAALGVRHAFGVVGSGNFHVTNALIAGGVTFTAARHEMGATTMADAYARLSRTVAVVSVHQGCGLTNALTGIGEAAKSNTPLLVVSGDTAVGDVTSNFFIDQDAAVTAIGAVARRIDSADSAVQDAAGAVRTAQLRRCPVVLSMPVDVQRELVDFCSSDIPVTPEPTPPPIGADLVGPLVDAIGAAERPVIVAGRGGWEAVTELRRLAAVSGALLATSAAGRGLFVGDDWALDVMGGFATEPAADLIRGADVIVAVGVALNTWTTRNGDLLGRAKVFHIDDQAAAFGLHQPVHRTILGDAAAIATATADELERRSSGRTGYRTPAVGEQVRAARYWKDQPFAPRVEPGRVDPQELTNALDALLPLQRVVIPDGGNVNCYPGAHLRVPDERGYCLPLSFQAIGMGLAAGIGAGLARPDRLPVVGTGDGAFMMSLVELDTAVRLRLGMVVIVYNDDAYGAEVNIFRSQTEDLDIVRFPDTDIAAIGRGFGCDGVTVRQVSDLHQVDDWLAGPRDRPLVIDAKIVVYPSWLMARGHRAGSTERVRERS